MEYLIKSAAVLAMFILFYKIFLQKETFYKSNRIFFLLGLFLAVVLPFFIIYNYIDMPVNTVGEVTTQNFEVNLTENITVENNQNYFDLSQLLVVVYFAAVLLLFLKMIIELLSLLKLISKGRKTNYGDYVLVNVSEKIMPFSFFKWIVYHKNSFSSAEFEKILSHEKIHVKHWHSVDMLIIRIMSIIQWFNPFVWLYKRAMEQNLEFIADSFAQNVISNLKEYQYLLLKTSVDKSLFALTNNYFSSNLKTRIMMLQKSKTNKINQVKYFLMMPLIVFFLYAFNVEEVYKTDSSQIDRPSFIMPVAKKSLVRLIGFGMRKNHFTIGSAMHNGVDYITKKGANVFASASGKVIAVGENSKDGKFVKISHNDNYQTNYFHLDRTIVSKAAIVKQGEKIGEVGNTGASAGPHLHFEVLKEGKFINPINLFKLSAKINSEKHNNYTFDKKSSDSYLNNLGKLLEKESGVGFVIEVVRKNGNIVSYTLRIKYPNTKDPKDVYITYKHKGIDKTHIKMIEDQKFVVWTKLSKVTISKDKTVTKIFDKKKSNDMLNKNVLYVINGKEYSGLKIDKSLINKGKNHSIHLYKGEEAVKKYGEAGKEGVIKLYKDGHGFIKYKGADYVYNIKDNKVRFYNKFGDVIKKELATKLRLQLIKEDIANEHVTLLEESASSNYLKYKNETYYFTKLDSEYIFYNRFGKKVGEKLSKELQMILDKH
jgi:beta-lactamase regulating signal transducer with metallopeptidase domain